MEWCDEKIELLVNFSLQNTFLCGVKLSDFHNHMQRAASLSSAIIAIINFDAINWCQFVSCQISGAGFWSIHRRLKSHTRKRGNCECIAT